MIVSVVHKLEVPLLNFRATKALLKARGASGCNNVVYILGIT